MSIIDSNLFFASGKAVCTFSRKFIHFIYRSSLHPVPFLKRDQKILLKEALKMKMYLKNTRKIMKAKSKILKKLTKEIRKQNNRKLEELSP
jgi:predicted DNA-binding antitoxin AbrB/MazE fold protein